MNKLAATAFEAVRNASARSAGEPYDTDPGMCQKFVRMCLQAAYGVAVAEKFRAASARESAKIWLSSGHGFPASELAKRGGLQVGDILYKTEGSGGYGHVGILVEPNKVAENSSTKTGRVRGALGFRTLKQYGEFQVVGRWPEKLAAPAPAPEPVKFLLNDVVLEGASLVDGRLVAPLRSVLDALGLTVARIGDHRVEINRYYVYTKKA